MGKHKEWRCAGLHILIRVFSIRVQHPQVNYITTFLHSMTRSHKLDVSVFAGGQVSWEWVACCLGICCCWQHQVPYQGVFVGGHQCGDEEPICHHQASALCKWACLSILCWSENSCIWNKALSVLLDGKFFALDWSTITSIIPCDLGSRYQTQIRLTRLVLGCLVLCE